SIKGTVMRALLLAAVVAAGLTLVATTAVAAPLKVSAAPVSVEPGGSVVVRYAVKRRPAKLVLRLDGKRLRTVAVRKARGRMTVTLQRGIAPGKHRLTVCLGKACRSLTL